tara:strand:+ start:4068 stop:5093 length:1026 start_codon:yes stop_codon:yes gene_type:complete
MIPHEKKNNDLLVFWLSSILLLILIMIIVGGLTRLTNSGLSITNWELFKGVLPPFDQQSWETYFQSYKKIPQYKLLFPSMTLSEFKIIFYWEYIHRVLGRLIGLIVLLPLLYFTFIKKINIKTLLPFYIIFFLVVLQGIAGWFMVQSGLVHDVTVSHYRLSLHLILAFIIISVIFWQILNLKKNENKSFFVLTNKRIPFIFLIFLIFLQIIFGAFVSGLDAGKIYQSWPLMGNNYFPNDLEVIKFNDFLDLESHSLVQFYHRNIAYFIIFYVIVLSFFIFKKKDTKLLKPLYLVIALLTVQVVLGIFTLLSNLHIVLASSHQITSAILVLSALNLYYNVIK